MDLIISIIVIIGIVYIFARLFFLSIKLAWGIAKIAFWVFLVPAGLIALVLCGLIVIALPILAVIGLYTIIESV